MKTEQKKWNAKDGWVHSRGEGVGALAQLVFVFGATEILKTGKFLDEVKTFYPQAHILSCSTAGEILGTSVSDNNIVITAIHFEKTQIKFTETPITNSDESLYVGRLLGTSMKKEGLVHAMVFSDGLKVNGTHLISGLLE